MGIVELLLTAIGLSMDAFAVSVCKGLGMRKMRYDQALALAAQTLIGAAGTALTSGKHPGKLQAEVCSPAGTTIAGVRTLEQRGFRAAAMDAVIAAYERTKELAGD